MSLCNAADDQKTRLAAFFKPYVVPEFEDEQFGDDVTYGECWEIQDPEKVEWWSVTLVPTTNKLALMCKYRTVDATLPISL